MPNSGDNIVNLRINVVGSGADAKRSKWRERLKLMAIDSVATTMIIVGAILLVTLIRF